MPRVPCVTLLPQRGNMQILYPIAVSDRSAARERRNPRSRIFILAPRGAPLPDGSVSHEILLRYGKKVGKSLVEREQRQTIPLPCSVRQAGRPDFLRAQSYPVSTRLRVVK
jgi:hypothetical protein